MITSHADVVGSLRRPAKLLAAQKQLAAGTITAVEFKEIQDRAVDEAIALQESVGLEVVTDGAVVSPVVGLLVELPGNVPALISARFV